MEPSSNLKILFIINPASGGKKKIQWEPLIRKHFAQLSYQIDFFILTGKGDAASINHLIKKLAPAKVVAVGGDGTISMVAEQLMNTSIPIGILRGGSANGMAAELAIPDDPASALDTIINGIEQKCDLIRLNETRISMHLSDLGLNARLIKYYDQSAIHGMWGYVRMILKILIEGKPLKAHISTDGNETDITAYMIVFANSTKYGTGAVINPHGAIDDGKFELVVVRQISVVEFAKLFLRHSPFNPKKVEIIQTTKAVVQTKRKIHFQVDGEYLGRKNKVTAEIVPRAVTFIVPKQEESLKSKIDQ